MDLSESAKGVSAVAPRAGGSSAYSRINDIKFNFTKKNCATIVIEINLGDTINFEIDYSFLDFYENLKRQLSSYGMGILDIQSIGNLFQVRVVDHLLVKAIKKGMQDINDLSSQDIFFEVKETQDDADKVLKDCIKRSTQMSNDILAKINLKHQKINDLMKKFPMEVYERAPLINRSIEELTDNLHRKFILVVNQLIELQRGHTITESHLADQVKSLIDNL